MRIHSFTPLMKEGVGVCTNRWTFVLLIEEGTSHAWAVGIEDTHPRYSKNYKDSDKISEIVYISQHSEPQLLSKT